MAVAGAVAAGAWTAAPLPLLVVLGFVVLALVRRRPWAWMVAGALAASSLAARAEQGLVAPERGPMSGEVVLVTDPESAFGAVRAEVREASGRRCQAVARGAPGAVVEGLLAGETAWVEGRVEALHRPHLAVRHVACQIVVERVGGTGPGGLPSRVANVLRRTLTAGGSALPRELRGLYTGFVLGDSRGQLPEMVDDFRASGLTHLLVVSGQNVAFVLLCAAPFLARLRPWVRFLATGATLAFFALLTRFEPSVLRATAMAGLAALALAQGRRASGLRLLAGAVALLLLVDPFLVRSVGFGLSVGASAGILLLAGAIERGLPLPSLLARPVGVVLAAQLGVAPVLVPTFGGIQVASLPANLLAGPVSGFVMVWGLTAGLVAGIASNVGGIGTAVAVAAMAPMRVALAWVAWVAGWTTSLGLGELELVGGLVAAAGGVGAVVARRRGRRGLASALLIAALCPVAVAGLGGDSPGIGRHAVLGLGDLWIAEGQQGERVSVLVLDSRASPLSILEAAREAELEELDLVVSTSGGPAASARLRALRHRTAAAEVWAPSGSELEGALTPAPGELAVGDLRVVVKSVEPRLEVEVGKAVEGDQHGL